MALLTLVSKKQLYSLLSKRATNVDILGLNEYCLLYLQNKYTIKKAKIRKHQSSTNIQKVPKLLSCVMSW